jgi:copper transport protein
VHFYLFDRKTGAAFEATKEFRVTASMPSRQIAPIELSTSIAGPGHYVVTGATLSVAGEWTITLADRISDFDEYVGRFTVPIE